MDKHPILIVDDDLDDLTIIMEVFKSLKFNNPVITFQSGRELKDYLSSDQPAPFLIICDMNLPREDGFAVRRAVLEDPRIRYKSVPFIFWSTAASDKQIQTAYDNHAQGFFFKPNSLKAMEITLRRIVEYWMESKHPVDKS